MHEVLVENNEIRREEERRAPGEFDDTASEGGSSVISGLSAYTHGSVGGASTAASTGRQASTVGGRLPQKKQKKVWVWPFRFTFWWLYPWLRIGVEICMSLSEIETIFKSGWKNSLSVGGLAAHCFIQHASLTLG